MKEFIIKRKPFFYDAQLKRYLVQIGACFAGYQVMSGKQKDGLPRFRDIPLVMASQDRVVSHYLSGGQMNTVLSVPVFSLEVTGLKQKPESRRAPSHSEVVTYRERLPQGVSEGDMSTNTSGAGGTHDIKQVERYMPVPYDLNIRLSLWASNMDEVFQVTEQLGQQFNDELDIQLSNSPLDWTYLTTLKFAGSFDFTKSVKDIGGGGGNDDYHIVNMEFSTVVNISPPAKVYNAQIIEEIHFNIREQDKALETSDWSSQDLIDGFIIRTAD